MAKKGAMPTFSTVDDYIANQSEEAQEILRELRSLIIDAVPEVVELRDYKVPSYMLVPGAQPAQQLMMAAYSKNVSFYPYQSAIDHFVDELKNYETGKGTVKFQFGEPLPKNLIQRMVMFRKEEITNSL